ncbi:MAG: hypothetical protein IJ568_07880 [Bacilli bacterium]|nr:hypothetical protein [Bacilli bacterium]
MANIKEQCKNNEIRRLKYSFSQIRNFFISKKVINNFEKYILCRNYDKEEKIIKFYEENLNKIIKNPYLEHFYNIMINNFNKEDLVLLNYNIKTLVINYSSLKFESFNAHAKIKGIYNSEHNIIKISKDYIDESIYHEFLHMASSYFTKDRIDHSGLSQTRITKNDFINIGSTLNEGYTEVLNKRYFQDELYTSVYPFESFISELIEEIIGKRKMEKMYLSADLNGFINELSKYDDKENVIDLIKSLDILYCDLPNDLKYENLYSIFNTIVNIAVNESYNNDREKLLRILNNIPKKVKTNDCEFNFDVQEMTNKAFDKKKERILKKY